jgi:hypothetical protein
MSTLYEILNKFVDSNDQFCFALCDGATDWFAETYIDECRSIDGEDLEGEAILQDGEIYMLEETEYGENVKRKIFSLKTGRWDENGKFKQ